MSFSWGRGGSEKDSNLPKVMWDCLVPSVPLNCSVATGISSLFLNLSKDPMLLVAIIQKPCPLSILLMVTRCFNCIKFRYFITQTDPDEFMCAHSSHQNRVTLLLQIPVLELLNLSEPPLLCEIGIIILLTYRWGCVWPRN